MLVLLCVGAQLPNNRCIQNTAKPVIENVVGDGMLNWLLVDLCHTTVGFYVPWITWIFWVKGKFLHIHTQIDLPHTLAYILTELLLVTQSCSSECHQSGKVIEKVSNMGMSVMTYTHQSVCHRPMLSVWVSIHQKCVYRSHCGCAVRMTDGTMLTWAPASTRERREQEHCHM